LRFARFSPCRYNDLLKHNNEVFPLIGSTISTDRATAVQLIRVPQGVENVEEFTIATWLKSEGDPVATGEAVLEALTDKASFQIEAKEDGILRRVVAHENSTVPVGYVVGIIAEPNEDLPDVDVDNELLLKRYADDLLGVTPSKIHHTNKDQVNSVDSQHRVRATPAARRLAKEADVSLKEVAAGLEEGIVLTKNNVADYLRGRAK